VAPESLLNQPHPLQLQAVAVVVALLLLLLLLPLQQDLRLPHHLHLVRLPERLPEVAWLNNSLRRN